jgi:hypothetical protein
MEPDLLKAIATVPATAGQRRRAQTPDATGDFGAQVAAFYPYPPAPEPGARAPAPERQRGGTVGASTGIGRRRQPSQD